MNYEDRYTPQKQQQTREECQIIIHRDILYTQQQKQLFILKKGC